MADLELRQLRKEFVSANGSKTVAVGGVDLAVPAGRRLVVVGPSGCGKTTLLRLIAGLETPTAGEIAIGRQCINRLPPGQRDVAMVFQHPVLYPHLTVKENLALPLRIRRMPAAQREERVIQTARRLGLAERLSDSPATLSGGQQQRVALGRAWVRQASILLLDEPFTHLDAPWRQRMREELAGWHETSGATVIYVTHDQDEAMAIGQDLAVMQDGRWAQVGTPIDIYRQPASPFVAGFVGSPPMNLIKGTIAEIDQRLVFVEATGVEPDAHLAPWRRPVPLDRAESLRRWIGIQITMGFRPDDLTASLSASSVEARVERLAWCSGIPVWELRSSGHSVRIRLDRDAGWAPGKRVGLEWAGEGSCCFWGPEGTLIAGASRSYSPPPVIHRPDAGKERARPA